MTALRREYEPKGIQFIHLDVQKGRIPIHGKFLLWDSDNVVISSLNWASATVDGEDQLSEFGLHVNGPGVADFVLSQLEAQVPHVTGEFRLQRKTK